ncbi:MAG: hypothetical protein R3C17_20550 [Planctomycetaceae bacterium]
MGRIFPFGFESHLSFYLAVYVLTLVVHIFLMSYVLAGSLWLAWATLFPGGGLIPRAKQPLAAILRDWMPFALSGAITAGVAPLLFVQILYRHQFYTANLILGWRWMVVIPVLVTAFYLLYVVKSRTVSHWSVPARLGLSVSIAFCFLFVAFCWTANHLLSLNPTTWPEAYRSGNTVRSSLALMLRLVMWVAGTFPALSILASWQLRGAETCAVPSTIAGGESDRTTLIRLEHRRLGTVSIAGLTLAFACATGYWTTLEPSVQTQLVGSIGLPWLLMVVASGLFQVIVWLLQLQRPCICSRWLSAITIVMVMMLIGTASLREIVRLSQADLDQLAASTRAAAAVGGFELFIVFTMLNAVLIFWCIRMVRSAVHRR